MTDHITIPIDVIEAAVEALGNFVSDHGWTDSDMQAMDNLDSYIARHKANQAARDKLAKPEQEESFIPDWANYRQGVADGKAGSPKWHDAPTEPGWWVRNSYEGIGVYSISEPSIKFLKGSAARWYGPIPQDGEKS
jgi:hypothetical protein